MTTAYPDNMYGMWVPPPPGIDHRIGYNSR